MSKKLGTPRKLDQKHEKKVMHMLHKSGGEKGMHRKSHTFQLVHNLEIVRASAKHQRNEYRWMSTEHTARLDRSFSSPRKTILKTLDTASDRSANIRTRRHHHQPDICQGHRHHRDRRSMMPPSGSRPYMLVKEFGRNDIPRKGNCSPRKAGDWTAKEMQYLRHTQHTHRLAGSA